MLFRSHLATMDGLIEASPNFEKGAQAAGWHAAVQTLKDGCTQAGVFNLSPEPLTIRPGTVYGTVTRLREGPRAGIMALDTEEPPTPRRETPPKSHGQLPDWYYGPTTRENQEDRARVIMDTFHLDRSPFLTTKSLLADATALLLEYFELFAWDGKPGLTTLVQHHIELTPGARPVRSQCRPVNPALEDKLRQVLQHWEENGIIVPSQSEWASPLVLVPKKDGGLRVCVDFRRLNAQTKRDNFDIGNVMDLLARMGRSKIFSTLDGDSAFLHIKMTPESQPMTDRKSTRLNSSHSSVSRMPSSA